MINQDEKTEIKVDTMVTAIEFFDDELEKGFGSKSYAKAEVPVDLAKKLENAKKQENTKKQEDLQNSLEF